MIESELPYYERPELAAGDVARAAGISNTVLQQWCSRDIVRFEDVRMGGRTFRRFTVIDAVAVSLMNELRKLGINPTESKDVAALARAGIGQRIWMLDDPEGFGGQTGRYFAVYASGSPVFFERENTIEDILKGVNANAAAVIMLDLDRIIKRTLKFVSENVPAEASIAEFITK